MVCGIIGFGGCCDEVIVPGSCSICPTISGLSINLDGVDAPNTLFDDGLADPDQPFRYRHEGDFSELLTPERWSEGGCNWVYETIGPGGFDPVYHPFFLPTLVAWYEDRLSFDFRMRKFGLNNDRVVLLFSLTISRNQLYPFFYSVGNHGVSYRREFAPGEAFDCDTLFPIVIAPGNPYTTIESEGDGGVSGATITIETAASSSGTSSFANSFSNAFG